MGEKICELKNVSKFFEKKEYYPLKNLDMVIEKGNYISVEGPSGIGKSTLLYLIGGLLQPTNGEIFYYGKKIEDFSKRAFLSLREKTLVTYFRIIGL